MVHSLPSKFRLQHWCERNFFRGAALVVCLLGMVATGSVIAFAQNSGQRTADSEPASGFCTVQARGTKVLCKDLRIMGTPIQQPLVEGVVPQGHSVPGHGLPPVVGVVEPVRTLKVGESQVFTFTFSDPENDPLFAGVIGFLPQPLRDARFFSNTRIHADRSRLGRAADIEVLPSPGPNVIVWRVTALRPGAMALLLLATELFADVKDGQLRLFAGNLSFTSVAVSVIDGDDAAQPPVFDDLPPDFTLHRGESLTWTSTSRSPAARPLTFGYGVISFAGRIVEVKFSDNALRLKAMEGGKAIMLGYVTDGFKVQTFARRVTVVSTQPGDENQAATKIRAVSSNIFPAQPDDPEPVDVVVFGEALTAAAQVVIVFEQGNQVQTVPFTARSATQGKFSWSPGLPGGYLVWLSDATGKQLTEAFRLRAVGVQVTSLLRLRRSANAPVTALLVQGQGFGEMPTIFIDGQSLRVLVKRSLRNRLNQRVLVKLPTELQNRPGVMVQLVNENGLTSDVFFLPLV